jgi:hypothetical protein
VGPRSVVALLAVLSSTAYADRVVHLVRDGATVRPGANDARARTSSIAKHEVTVPAWTTTDETWAETVACLERVYAPFDVTFTEEEPEGEHIAAVFGGSPLMLGLPRSYAGISPFEADCSIIESSIVFTFTDILPPDAATACRVMAQEIGHSYGLDHELRAGDPMSTLPFDGERAFVDEDVACGEDSPRPCGLPGTSCRATQSSYALLADRLGMAGDVDTTAHAIDEVGCATSRGGSWIVGAALALSTSIGRARARRRGARALR